MSNINEEDIARYQENKYEFSEDNPFLKTTIGHDLWEWSKLITELSEKETQLLEIKDMIFDKEQWIIENTDFKEAYGKNNSDVRKLHLSKHMKKEYDNRRSLELSIDYIKRRISFLKSLIRVKSVIMGVKE